MGMYLERFSEKNADLVLSWRNSEDVRQNSLDAGIIDKESHLKFVRSLGERPDRNFFIVHVNGSPVSVMNVNIIDDGVSAYWGCYIGNRKSVMPGVFPLMIALCGKLAFERYGCKRIKSDVLEHNSSPQKMNDYLGVRKIGERKVLRSTGEEVLSIEYAVEDSEWPQVESRLKSVLTKRQLKMLDNFDFGAV